MGYNRPRHGRQTFGQKAAVAVPTVVGVGTVTGVTVLAATAASVPAAFAATTTPTVTATNAHVDEFTGITATYTAPAPNSTAASLPTTGGVVPGGTLNFTATGVNLGALTWNGASAPTLALPAAPTTGSTTVTVTVKDAGGAEAVESVTVAKDGTNEDVTLSSDIVGLSVANANGEATFTTSPAGVGTTLGGVVPDGVSFKNGVLSDGTAVPGDYKSLTVTATDVHNAAAVETFDAVVRNVEVKPAQTPRPHLYGGHVIMVNNNDAQIGWSFGPGVHYVLTRTFGYGFSKDGSPHLGFTSDTVGYWSGLAAGHTYDIELIPAGADRQPLPNAQTGWITIVTTR